MVVVVQEVKVLEEAVNRQANAVLQKTRMLDDLNHTVAEVRTQQEYAPMAGGSHVLYAQSKQSKKVDTCPHPLSHTSSGSRCSEGITLAPPSLWCCQVGEKIQEATAAASGVDALVTMRRALAKLTAEVREMTAREGQPASPSVSQRVDQCTARCDS